MLFNNILSINNSSESPLPPINKTKKIKKFEIVNFPSVNKNFGEFTGKYPKTAAEKAFNLLANLKENEILEDGKFIVFEIQEKNNTSNKIKYIGTRILMNSSNNTKKIKNIIGLYSEELDKIKFKNYLNNK